MFLRVPIAFFKTAVYGLLLIGRSESVRTRLKQNWGHDILETFGYELEVRGRPPKSGSKFLVGNHISYLDIPVLLACAPTASFVSKDDLKKWPIIGAGAKAIGTIFVNRKTGSDRSEVRASILKRLTDHHDSKVIVFPSGTTALSESKFWKKGVFEIAQATGTPVQIFKIEYFPLRESAYIDQDQLLRQMLKVSKIPVKKITFTWLDEIREVREASAVAEFARQRVLTASAQAQSS